MRVKQRIESLSFPIHMNHHNRRAATATWVLTPNDRWSEVIVHSIHLLLRVFGSDGYIYEWIFYLDGDCIAGQ